MVSNAEKILCILRPCEFFLLCESITHLGEFLSNILRLDRQVIKLLGKLSA